MTEIHFWGMSRMTIEELITQANFTTGEDWDQVPERNRGGEFLSRGFESRKIKNQNEEKVWVTIMSGTPRTK